MKSNSAFGAVVILAFLTGLRDSAADEIVLKVHDAPTRLAASADGTILAATEGRGHILLWNIPEHRFLHDIDTARGDWRALAFSPNNELLASTSLKSIRLWNVATGEDTGCLDGHKQIVLSFDFSNDGKSLASISLDGMMIVWDVDSRMEKFHKAVFPGNNGHIAFRSDGSILVAGTNDNLICVWKVRDETAELVARAPHNGWDVNRFAFSPDRKTLALAVERRFGTDDDRDLDQIHLWDLTCAEVLGAKTLKLLGFQSTPDLREICPKWGKVLLGHRGPINAIEFTPDGNKLVSASGERRSIGYGLNVAGKLSKKKTEVRECAVKVWDASECQELAALKGHSASVRSLAISSDSLTVFSGSLDSTVRAWDIPANKAAETVD